ncbi:LuxR C-terminal-related transcriptional regulator [Streptomyces diastatochromogenes]|nr:LuxR C-terminal-related transcriptional regulator [Streptomyces diastatochromogenes]
MSESDNSPDLTQLPSLTEASRALLRRALRGEELKEDEPGFADLRRLGVLVREPFRPGIYVMAERQHIEDRLRDAAVRQIITGATFMSGIGDLLEDLDRERERTELGRQRSSCVSYFIDGIDGVHEVMSALVYGAKKEILSVQPGRRKRHLLNKSMPRDIELVTRGVKMRTIYQRVNLPVPHVRRYVAHVSAGGGEFRVTDAPLEKMVMIDRTHVFIPDSGSGRDHTAGAWHIRDPAAVLYLARIFDLEWLRAIPWDANPGPWETKDRTCGSAWKKAKTTARQRFILRGICMGQSYEQIGRQLGIKVRTVSTEMATARAKVGVDTNEALTYWFATSPDRSLTD